jgi:hypothetical protein
MPFKHSTDGVIRKAASAEGCAETKQSQDENYCRGIEVGVYVHDNNEAAVFVHLTLRLVSCVYKRLLLQIAG